MSFSKRNPVSIKFIEKYDNKKRDMQMEAFTKIRKYRKQLKNNPKMTEEEKDEIAYNIQKCRGRIKFNKAKTRKAIIKYKNVKISVPINELGMISPKKYSKYAEDIVYKLQKNRKDSKRKYKDIRKKEGQEYSLYGGVHEVDNSIGILFKKVARHRVNSMRKPGNTSNHVGVEIEFFSAYSRDDIVNRLIDAKLSKHARIMSDVSISAEDDKPCGLELCIVAPEDKINSVLEKACDVLNDIDAATNDSCGLHVHLDARNRNKKLLFHNLVKCQDLLFRMTNSTRRSNRYCEKQTSPEWDSAPSSHYSAINKGAYDKHRTIEIRMHQGTVNFSDVKRWVLFLNKIANYNEYLGDVTSINGLSRVLKIENNLKDELNQRIEIFS